MEWRELVRIVSWAGLTAPRWPEEAAWLVADMTSATSYDVQFGDFAA
ncbi:hypothetical protein ACGFW5_21315 [Streptomyces sp. NPDC048416]